MKTTGNHRETGGEKGMSFLAKTNKQTKKIVYTTSGLFFLQCLFLWHHIWQPAPRKCVPTLASLQSETSLSSQQKTNYGGSGWYNSWEKEELWLEKGWHGPALIFPSLVKMPSVRMPNDNLRWVPAERGKGEMRLGGGGAVTKLKGKEQDANRSFNFFTLIKSIWFGLNDETLTELSLIFYHRNTCSYTCLLSSNILSMLY